MKARLQLTETALSDDYGDNSLHDGPLGYPEAVEWTRRSSTALRMAVAGWGVGESRTLRAVVGEQVYEVSLTKNEAGGFSAQIQ